MSLSHLVENVVQTRLVADTSGYTEGFQRAAKSLKGFIDSNRTVKDAIVNATGALLGASPAALLAGGAITAVGLAAISSARQAAALAGELLPVAQRLGITTEELSKLKFAAEQSNTSFGDVQAGLRVLGQRAGAAAQGSTVASKAFKDLGIELRKENGQLKTSVELFREVADVVQNTNDPLLKAGKATSVLGRNAQSLIPLMNGGSEAIDAFGKEAEDLGVVISGRFAADVDAFAGNMNKLKALSVGAGQAIAQELIPEINKLLTVLVELGKDTLVATIREIQTLAFWTSKATASYGALDAKLKAFQADLRGDDAAMKVAIANLEKFNRTLNQTKEEFIRIRNADFSDVVSQADEIPPAAQSAALALKELAESFKDLDKEAIAPILAVAGDLIGTDGFSGITKAIDPLIAQLRDLAANSNVARKALEEVLKIRNQALGRELQAGQELQGPATEGGQRPLGIEAARRQAAEDRARELRTAQGPETATGEGPGIITDADRQAEAARRLQEGNVLQGPATAGGQGPIDLVQRFKDAQRASADFFQETIEGMNALNQAFLTFGSAIGDGLIDAIGGAKVAFGELFRNLLKDLAKAIVRATILTTIMSLFGGGALSIAKLTANIQKALGLGGVGFQDKESSILGRASQARSLPVGLGMAPAVAPAMAGMSAAPNFRVIVEEPGPFTKVRITDDLVIPRLRQRRRQLNEEPF